MEHRTSDSSKDNGVQFPGRLHMYGSSYQIQQLAGNTFFTSASSSNCPPQSQAPAHKSEAGSAYLSDLSSYMESFPFVDGCIRGSPSSHALTYGSPLRVGHWLEAPSGMAPEALLEAISLAQRKLQHLEVIVRMMIRGSAHNGMIQQHQSLSMEFASIMSQLFTATASFLSAPSFPASPPPAPRVNDTLDVSFDGFNEDELNNTLGGGILCALSSGMDATTSATCKGAGIGTMDVRSTEACPISSSNEAANIFTTLNVQGDIHLAKGNPCVPPENTQKCVVHGSDIQVLNSSEDLKEEDDDGEGETLPPGSYELVELAATEILAEHTHFCEICSKGFKRDANLRMHMRGHGDEYKTAAALARPDKAPRDASAVKPRRYSCPYAGCKRNKRYQKFLPLKTMLCVKNHYRRSHCPKSLICSRCKTKKFSVVADLKTHEKHCGQGKWQCSCGTTFSRKDKLYGHIALFTGHTPATPAPEGECWGGVGDGLEGLGNSKANVLGMAGLPASTMQDNQAATHVDVSQGMSVYDVPVMGMRSDGGSLNEQSLNLGVSAYDVSMMGFLTNTNDGGLLDEQSLNQREKGAFRSFSNGAMNSDSSFLSSTSTEKISDDLELHKLLSYRLFHQAGGSN